MRSISNRSPLRHGFTFRCLIPLLALVAGSVVSVRAQTPLTYSLADLGTLGGTFSLGMAVNDAAQVVGESYLPGGSVWQRDEHAFYWANGVMRDLGTLGGTWSHANAINAGGEIVGCAQISAAGNVPHACRWDSATHQIDDLNQYLSASDAAAYELWNALDINDGGLIVGQARVRSTGDTHPFVLDRSAQPPAFTDLGLLDGTTGWAEGVNATGQVVGKGGTPAFLYTGAFPLVSLAPMAYARDINGSGGIVGSASGGAAYRSPAGVITYLGTFGGSSSEAEAINDTGTVVGSAGDPKAGQLGFVWQVGGGAIRKLNDLTPNRGTLSIDLGRGISPAGLVAGRALGTTGTGKKAVTYEHAVLLRPQ